MLSKILSIIGVIIAIPLVGVAWENLSSGDGGELPDRSFNVQSRIMCADLIKRSLRNPASVEWDGRSTWSIIEDGGDLYTVIAKYRAENGFGGMVKETRQCLVARRESGAVVLAVE